MSNTITFFQSASHVYSRKLAFRSNVSPDIRHEIISLYNLDDSQQRVTCSSFKRKYGYKKKKTVGSICDLFVRANANKKKNKPVSVIWHLCATSQILRFAQSSRSVARDEAIVRIFFNDSHHHRYRRHYYRMWSSQRIARLFKPSDEKLARIRCVDDRSRSLESASSDFYSALPATPIMLVLCNKTAYAKWVLYK